MIATQYSRSMRIMAKVSVRPSGTGPGPSNSTDIPLTSHHLSASGLSTDDIRICLDVLVRGSGEDSSINVP